MTSDSQPTKGKEGDSPCATPDSPAVAATDTPIPVAQPTEVASNAVTQGAALGAAGGELIDWWNRKVTVCDKCLRACCWQGTFMCDEAQGAGIVEKTIRELIQINAGEHPEYWGWIEVPVRPNTPETELEDRQAEQDHAKELATEDDTRTPVPASSVAVRPADRDAGGEEFTRNDCPDCKGENLECGICGGIARGEPGAIRTDRCAQPCQHCGGTKWIAEHLCQYCQRILPPIPATPSPAAPVAREETATLESHAICKLIWKAASVDTPWSDTAALLEAAKNGIEDLESRLHAAEAERDNRPPQAEYEQLCASNSVYEKEVAQLRAEVARLTKERDEAQQMAEIGSKLDELVWNHAHEGDDAYDVEDVLEAHYAALATATARTEELEGALRKYGQHLYECGQDCESECFCGLDALLATRPATGSGETTGENPANRLSE